MKNIEKTIKEIEKKNEEKAKRKIRFIYIKYHKNISEDILNLKI